MAILIISILCAGIIIAALIWCGYRGYYFPMVVKRSAPGICRVACVGDSITYGFGIDNWFAYHYPRILQLLLGNQYYVVNFGLSGSTGMSSTKMSYRKFSHFRRSLSFQPNILIIMFGTNDANMLNWQGKTQFLSEYRDLLLTYKSLASKPEIFVMTPPLIHGNEEIIALHNANISTIRDCVYELVHELQLRAIDLYSETKETPDWFQPDGVHPNAKGAMMIAQVVYEHIRGTSARTQAESVTCK